MKSVRILCAALLLLSAGSVVHAQQEEAAKPKEEKPKEEKSKTNENESFGDYVLKVGSGIWGRVKERFNLDDTLANLEEKKNKILGDKDKKEEKNEKPKENDPPKKPDQPKVKAPQQP